MRLAVTLCSRFVEESIKQAKVVGFAKSFCPYCHKARNILEKHVGKDLPSDQLKWVELDTHPQAKEIQDYLEKVTGARTVPRIFINGKFIGGCSDTERLENAGKLATLLKN